MVLRLVRGPGRYHNQKGRIAKDVEMAAGRCHQDRVPRRNRRTEIARVEICCRMDRGSRQSDVQLDCRRPSSHVRITFQYPGSWSVIGTTCKSVPKDQPTMNFGWLTPGVADDEARRVIVHEFGHAIGLIHEHQRMDADGWNKQAVIADLSGPPNNWDAETIQHNMFDTYSAEEINGSKLDPTSIMMYPIPKSWRTDGLSAGLNTDLSATDRTFIKKVYP